jgi:hypothetical protein
MNQPSPNPNLSPADVVRIQLSALQHNDDPTPDAGIATAFQFAAPANRAITGPIDRFIKLVKNPLYAPMLNFIRADVEEGEMGTEEATLRVTVLAQWGEWVRYVFSLERQIEYPYSGCWMTAGVVHEITIHLN